ncbi:hypothetical protein [Brachyspira murdochii]|uniref:Uncharacterized protein n=1 Tax=Brachyspira murdochii (strain ATCC 51284 / DSM 12563 / 56-150) TaxID=526224 RepID=D5UB20_BRAM5|nr:hypothetical protein [Brachyspira murdochii]ADG71893.1 conserved hypothetical protein [Brachyspira murdochii DSM 12563]
MELYQEKLINALKMYQNDFDNMVNSFYDSKENFDSLIKKYSCESEDNVDKNYLLRARLAFAILYYKNIKALKKEAVKNIIIHLFEEEIKDRKTSKYKGIGISLEVLTFLLNKYSKDNKALFKQAKEANTDCSIGYDSDVRFEDDIEKLNILYTIHYALELGFKDLYYELIDIWKSSIKVWDRINLERLRDFEIEVGNKEGELNANKELYFIAKDNYEKNKKNVLLSKKNLFYLLSYLGNYIENLVRLSKYNEAYDTLANNIDDIKNIDAFYNINAGILIVDCALKIILNRDNIDKDNVLWKFVKIAFSNEHLSYAKTVYDNFIKCAEKMNDLEMKEKVLKYINN